MRLILRLICCAVVLTVLVVIPLPALAQTPVVVRVTPATLSLAVDSESDVAVEVVNVEGLYGFDVQLAFDPAIVEVVDADPDKAGVQVSLGRMLDPGIAVRDGADNAAGTIHYAMTQINPSEAKSGAGNLIVFRLRGKAAGTTALTISSVDLARRDATAIPAALQSGVVTVQAGASTQSTNTPIPTQAPPMPAPTGPADSGVAGAAPAQPTATVEVQPTATNPPLASSPPAPALSSTDTPATRASEVTPPAGTVAGNDAIAPTARPEPTLPEVSGTTVEPTAQPAIDSGESTATPQAVAVAPAGRRSSVEPASGERQAETSSAPERVLLTVGVIALLAALVIAAILAVLVLMRRRTNPL